MAVAGGAEVQRGPGWFDRAEWVRSPTLLRGDRCRFKDSYGPPGSGGAGGRRGRAGRPWRAAGGGEDDEVVDQKELDLRAQLQEAQAEVQQLRAALRASANALQKAASLLPPEYRKEVEEVGNLHNDLMEDIKRKDEEIHRLSKIEWAHANAGARYRRSVLGAIERWAPRGEAHLMKCCFESWHDCQRERRLRERREADVARLRPRIDRLLARWGAFGADAGAKAVLAQWLAVLRAAKADRLRVAQRQEKVAMALKAMATYYSQGSQAVCWAAWRTLYDARVRDRRAEAQRKEHERVAKEMRAQGVAKVVMELGCDSAAVKVQVLWRAWRECAVQGRAQMALEAERARVEADRQAAAARAEAERRAVQARARNNMLLLITGSSTACRQAFLIAWRTVAVAERHERELQKQHEEQVALLDKRRREFAEKEREKKIAYFATMFVEGNNAVLGIVLVAWLAVLQKEHRSKLEQAKEREAARLEKYRLAAAALFVSDSQKGLIHVLWSAWVDDLRMQRQEKAEAERLRIKAEKQKLEEERLAREEAEKQKLEEERLAREEAERRRAEEERLAQVAEQALEEARRDALVRLKEEKNKRMKAMFGILNAWDTGVLRRMAWAAWLQFLQEGPSNPEVPPGGLPAPAMGPEDPEEPVSAVGGQLGSRDDDPHPPLPPPAQPPPPDGRRHLGGVLQDRSGEEDPEFSCCGWLCPRRRGGVVRGGRKFPPVQVVPDRCTCGKLAPFRTEWQCWCNVCEAEQPVGASMDGCLSCDYTVCSTCVGRRTCNSGHPLVLREVADKYFCDRCGENQPTGAKMEECASCSYHLCETCCRCGGRQAQAGPQALPPAPPPPPTSTQRAPAARGSWATAATAEEALPLAQAVSRGPPSTHGDAAGHGTRVRPAPPEPELPGGAPAAPSLPGDELP